MESEQFVSRQSQIQTKDLLTFTGNWFIDAGILGFVNLMEEVYGWDLDELQNIYINDSPRLFYWFFPIGYLFYHSTIRGIYKKIQEINKEIFKENGLNQKIREIKEEIKKLQDEITKTTNEQEKKKLEKKLLKLNEKIATKLQKKDDMLSKIDKLRNELMKKKLEFKENVTNFRDFFNLEETKIKDLLPNFNLNLPAIARNFYLFNSREVRENSFLAFRYLQLLCLENYEELDKFIKEKIPKSKKAREGLSYEVYPDSTVNPFLYSSSEFPNIGYTQHLKTIEIKRSLRLSLPIFISLLCFEHAFENYYEKKNVVRNTFFYTNTLDVCYSINKRMRIKKERALDKSKYQSLLKMTLESVFDELVENKANFSMENMYLIEYEGIEEQKLINVEYIGIPKLQAAILLDDTIRENLNKSIQFRSKNSKEDKYRWLVEEFIKGRPLYPIIMNHVNLVLNDEIDLKDFNACFYSLVVEAKILEFRAEKGRGIYLFSKNYFENYKHLVDEIKREIRFTSFKASLINQLSEESETNKRIARELFDALKGKNKNMFLNILIKNLNENKKLCSNKNLNDWIFEKIIKNDETFEMYGLILIMNLLKKY
jgi:CRISPR-associated protein Cst1